MSGALSLADYVLGVRAGDRTVLARAITLVESRRRADGLLAQELLAALRPDTGGAVRVGLSGVPGVGKSTLIERLGLDLVAAGQRVAVLAVDPSSAVTGGSVLGDKSRMGALAAREEAFIRPSPSARGLGGVTRRTRETLLLCEAAGFDVVLVETVGVGQSETLVRDAVDTFVLLLLPGGGDELQGVKRGILELADIVAVNKADADGGGPAAARATCAEYGAALRYARRADQEAGWRPAVLAVSARTGDGVADLWERVVEHRAALEEVGVLEERRAAQERHWLRVHLEEQHLAALWQHPDLPAALADAEGRLTRGETTPGCAAAEVLARLNPRAGGDPDLDS